MVDVLEDYISKNLNVIGQIQLHSKINIRNGNIYIEEQWWGVAPVKRYVMGDNRYDTLEFIRTLIHGAFVISDRIILDKDINSKYLSILKRIGNDLKKSIEGINNIKDTYLSDARITSSVEVLIDNIDVQNKKIDGFISEHSIKDKIC